MWEVLNKKATLAKLIGIIEWCWEGYTRVLTTRTKQLKSLK